jgi:hypothetical protein
LKKYKTWFDKGCSELVDQRNQGKLQHLQDLSEINEDNLNNMKAADVSGIIRGNI